jgi:hypothetical protein
MKHLRQFCLIIALVCACAFSVYAGDIECTGLAAPSQAQPTSTGQVDCPGLTEAAMSLIQSVLSLT